MKGSLTNKIEIIEKLYFFQILISSVIEKYRKFQKILKRSLIKYCIEIII